MQAKVDPEHRHVTNCQKGHQPCKGHHVRLLAKARQPTSHQQAHKQGCPRLTTHHLSKIHSISSPPSATARVLLLPVVALLVGAGAARGRTPSTMLACRQQGRDELLKLP
jgi:hypothetical protein